MASRPRGYGLTAELNRKKEEKFDADLANELVEWMQEAFREAGQEEEAKKINVTIKTQSDFQELLKDGELLCKIVNVVKPGCIKKINTHRMAFKDMANIENFLISCEKVFGCRRLDLFQVVDLFEGQNIPQVISGVIAFGRKAQLVYDGPALGPPESSTNKREFTDEQLRASDGIIGLQAGFNAGATQAGLNFGKTRAIID